MVSGLLYIADTAAVLAEGEKIIKEALSQFSINEAVCIQRIGQLKTTETAVWIGVWAPTGMRLLKAAAISSKKLKKDCSSGKKNFIPTAIVPGSTEPKNLLSFDMKTYSPALLSAYTTFQLGGPCPCMVECATPDELIQTVQKFKKENTPFLLIGGGSNLVVSDHGLDTTVIRYVSPTPLIERNGHDITVSASTVLDDLGLFCVDEGLEGLNFTTGIPGTVGGAVAGNAGAWGKQVGDVLKSALILDDQGKPKPWGLIILLFPIVIRVLKKQMRSLFP